ncbi:MULTISPECIES: NADH-dependent flavin oxidoreductase [unclassified Sporolactobacillus]|uniref:NADH-dependent flavin oxidoreductase n=1 Tax=unclassified Sporolactobacillus TaxID=2628533 RepID=UPI0023686B1F|nr:NADH-dependent flavin oxidoreductase [Sporolactobacillus sp. CQH2019]MDD9149655.1 NADH-dependent flavin oxidoreductase [Sporolactobacillus sp. CQH2019]
MKQKYSKLMEPLTFKSGITVRNRIVMAPMTTWSANDDLTVSDEEVKYYKRRVNGAGLVITGTTFVAANGIGFTNEFAGYDDKFIPSLRKLADAAKCGGAPAVLQIFHAGNKAAAELIPNGDLVSASPIETEATTPFAGPGVRPRALTEKEILDIIKQFGETTRRAIEAGFDGVEVHGAHGFLIQNFFSPHFNQRKDQWGGTLENRLRFPLAVVREIKKTVKKYAKKPFIVGYRFSPEERSIKDGLAMDDTYVLIDRLAEEGLDYIHASLGNVFEKYKNNPNEKTRLELIVERADRRIPLIAAGSVRKPDDALKALELGLPLVALGRALIINPTWVEWVADGREEEIKTKLQAASAGAIDLPEKLRHVIQTTPGWF